MINLYHVKRIWPHHESIVGSFLIKRHARQFMRECQNLSANNGAKFELQESHISTYGMAEESRREIVQSLNIFLSKES